MMFSSTIIESEAHGLKTMVSLATKLFPLAIKFVCVIYMFGG